jgi:nitrite reductase (NO-forming)
MIPKLYFLVLAGVSLPVAALGLMAAASRPERVAVTDFGATITETRPAFTAAVGPADRAPVKEFRIPITHDTVEIAAGVRYAGWTFGGTVPGPVLRVREGDLVRIRLVNDSPMPHSIDFHAARIPMNEAFRTIGPTDSLSFSFTARDPGVYLVHCGTPPVLMHIMQGMYLAIVVDPKGGWPTKADREFVLVQSEFYTGPAREGVSGPDYQAALGRAATYVTFNGRAFQYQETPLAANVGDRVRFFVANAGPSLGSDFHVVGAIFDRVYPDGDPSHALAGVQTWHIPAGGGAVFETVFERDASGEGVYAFVTHAFADAAKGAVGLLRVGEPAPLAHAGH